MSHNKVSWPAFWCAILDLIKADFHDERWSHLCSYSDVELLRLVMNADLVAECIDRHRAWLELLRARDQLYELIHSRRSIHRRDPELSYAGFEVSAPPAARPPVGAPQVIDTPSFLTPEGTVRFDRLLPAPPPVAAPPRLPSAQVIPISPVNSSSIKLSDLLREHAAKKVDPQKIKVYSQPL